jgi:hypothetical protein
MTAMRNGKDKIEIDGAQLIRDRRRSASRFEQSVKFYRECGHTDAAIVRAMANTTVLIDALGVAPKRPRKG